MSSKKGKKFNSRDVAPNRDDGTLATANQWQATEQQLKWFELYMNPRHKETYANAYQAAVSAGYSESHAKIIATKNAPEWTKAGRVIMRSMKVDHLRNALEEIVTDNMSSARDKIQAIKLLGVDQGMFVEKRVTAHIGIEEALRELD